MCVWVCGVCGYVVCVGGVVCRCVVCACGVCVCKARQELVRIDQRWTAITCQVSAPLVTACGQACMPTPPLANASDTYSSKKDREESTWGGGDGRRYTLSQFSQTHSHTTCRSTLGVSLIPMLTVYCVSFHSRPGPRRRSPEAVPSASWRDPETAPPVHCSAARNET